MTYPQALDFLNSFVNYERFNFYPYQSSFKLGRLRKLLQALDSPHEALRSIHIAGTKGKGSTCAFAANILKEANFKVGLYTSPHLIDVRERIRIVSSFEKELISKKDFARLIGKIKLHAEKLRRTKLGELTYYEILTALAFLYFKEQNCDFVVLETGIGGRLDATNVASSLISAFTPISYEHTQVLGKTLEKISMEKAAIIKVKSQIVITAPQRPTVLKIIKRRARKVGADLYEVGKDIQIKERSATFSGQCFDIKGIFGKYYGFKIGLLGRHQIINAAVALGCAEALRNYGIGLSHQAIREGLKNTRWPGRLQIISRNPRVILDAAHNQASARSLKEALARFFKFRNLILVFGVSQDKDVKGILRELVPISSRIVLTKTENPRAMKPETIKALIRANSRSVILTDNSRQALKIAVQQAKQEDLILVSGSLYLLGEILKSRRQWKNCFQMIL